MSKERMESSDHDNFYGRTEELAELQARLGQADRIAIVGPPGIGKSRLAREFARRNDSVLFVAGGPPMEVLMKVLGISSRGKGEEELSSEVLAHLDALAMLVCEGDPEPFSDLVPEGTSLCRCDGVAGDFNALPLEGLCESAAVEMLIDRVTRWNPALDRSALRGDSAKELLKRVEFSPAGIEELARRLLVFQPDELARLARERGVSLRMPTEEASHDVLETLTEDECRIVELGYHLRGGFSAETLAEVLSIRAPHAADYIARMVQMGIVRRTDGPEASRARFVVEPRFVDAIRGAGSEETGEVFDATVRFVVSRAQAWWKQQATHGIEPGGRDAILNSQDLIRLFEALRLEHPEQALAIGHTLIEHQYETWTRERVDHWIRTTGELAGHVGTRLVQKRQSLVEARTHFKRRNYAAVVECLEPLSFEVLENPEDFLIELVRARALHRTDAFEPARQRFSRLAEHCPKTFRGCLAHAYLGLGWSASTSLDFAQASQHFARATSLASELGLKSVDSDAARSHLAAALVTGDFEGAAVHGRRMLELLDRCGDPDRIGGAHLLLADVHVHRHDLDAAEDAIERACGWIDGVEFSRMQGYARFARAKVELARGNPDEALAELARGQQYFGNDPAAFVLVLLEEVARVMRDPGGIRLDLHDDLIEDAYAYWQPLGLSAKLLLIACRRMARSSRVHDDDEVQASLEFAREHGMSAHASAARLLLGENNEALGFDARLVERMLGRGSGQGLEIGSEAGWFSLNGGPRVAIARRKALPQILKCLVESHGSTVDALELAEAGWSDEDLHPDAATNRVYVAVHQLRKLGLEPVLITQGRGYSLQKNLEIKSVDSTE